MYTHCTSQNAYGQKNKLIRDVFMFAFDLLVCYILCLARLAFCFSIFLFLKPVKLAWMVRAVFVMLCDSKRKKCLMNYSFEYMWQSVDVNPISLLSCTKSVMRVLVLWSFCSMLVFIDLCVTCCFFSFWIFTICLRWQILLDVVDSCYSANVHFFVKS